MGNFIGHALPGFFFLLVGVWSGWSTLARFFVCKRDQYLCSRGDKKTLSKYKNTLLYSCFCCQRLPMAAILILASTTLGIIGEWITAYKNGKFTHIGNVQHITMYFFFGLMAFVSILKHYRFNIPPKTDYLAAALAVLIEGLLFSFHFQWPTDMDVQVHSFLVYLIAGTFLSGLLEMVYEKNVIPAICRAYFIFLQGTWFFQIGFILHPPAGMESWNEDSHFQMMIVTIIYAWHFALAFIVFLLMSFLINCKVKIDSRKNTYRSFDVKKTENGGNLIRHQNGVRRQLADIAVLEESEEDLV